MFDAYLDALNSVGQKRQRSPATCGAKTNPIPTNLPPEGSPPQATEADHEADDGDSKSSTSSEASDVSDFFDTLTELYLFFRDADLSRREVNRLLNIFRNPQFSLKELRKWRSYADVKRWGKERAPPDMVPWKTEHIVVHGPRGMSQKLLLHFRDTELLVKKLVRIFSRRKGFVWKPQEKYNEKGKRVFEGPETGTWMHEAQKEIKDDKALILGVIVYSDSTQASRNGRRNAWPVLISLINIPEELRWFELGHTLAAVLPFCPEWASPTEKARVFQEALKIILGPLMRETASAPVRYFYVTDATGNVVKAVPCLYGYPGDYPENSRASATLQTGTHRPCANCYAEVGELKRLTAKIDPRTPERQKDICVLARWNFGNTTWGNVYLACLADILHVLDSGVFVHMMEEYLSPLGKVEIRILERRKKDLKSDTPSVLLRIPGGSSFFLSGAHYAAFEHRAMMQIMPILIADSSALKKGEAGELRALQVRAFRYYALFYKAFLGVAAHTRATLKEAKQRAVATSELHNCLLCRLMELLPKAFPDQASKWEIPKVHMIKHLLENVEARGMPHHYSTEMWERTHKGTVKGPVRGSNWADIPRRIVDEEMQREIYREVAADAGGGRQYVSALRVAVEEMEPVLTKKFRVMRLGGTADKVFAEYAAVFGDQMAGLPGQLREMQLNPGSVQTHTAVAIPRTQGGVLVAKGTFVKASPRENLFSDVALLALEGGDWFARCLCIFKALNAEGKWTGCAYVSSVKPPLKDIVQKMKVLPDDVFLFVEIPFMPSRLPKTKIPGRNGTPCDRIISVGFLYNATGTCTTVPLVVLRHDERPEPRRSGDPAPAVIVRYTKSGRLTPEVFTEFFQTVDGVQLSRGRKTVVFTYNTAHRITANDAETTVEHGLTMVHFTHTRFVDLTDVVHWSSMPFLHGVVDAFKAEYRVILMRRAVRSNLFHEDFEAPFSLVNYGVMLLWVGLAWKALTAATMQRSWWRAGCVPESWWELMWHLHGMYSAGMYDPLVSTTADLLVLLREFRVRPAIYMPVSDYVTCDEWLMEKAGVKLVTPTTPTSSGDEGEMCLPDGPLMRDERSRRRAIRNVTNAYVCHAEALGIAPAEVATVVGASDGEVVSRLSRTPKKRARSSGSSDSGSV
ncbi:unnamed protein product [Closterium sp. Yama58-4]|nr:unnamed protein product [Closterium sp. Yama58-4]